MVNERGQIYNENIPPDDNWKMIGISHVKRSWFIPFSELFEFLDAKPDILWKNGNPQWTVRDLDHGSVREWGNTRWHGIKSIWFEGEEKFFYGV
jgi:hypothetical protein